MCVWEHYYTAIATTYTHIHIIHIRTIYGMTFLSPLVRLWG